MLYTLSQGDYADFSLLLESMTENDAVLLWQDGVLLALKYPEALRQSPAPCFALQADITARNLTALLPQNDHLRLISLPDAVELTEKYFPQVAL